MDMCNTSVDNVNRRAIRDLIRGVKRSYCICGDLYKHHAILELANQIAVVGGGATAHDVRQRGRCHNCGVKGNNTYQIIWRGNSGVALDGAGVRLTKDAD